MRKFLLALMFLSALQVAEAFGGELTSDPNYQARCKICHGNNAEGKATMKIPALASRANRDASELTKAIEDGNSTSTPKMPSFKEKLTAEDIKTLVAEIKALK